MTFDDIVILVPGFLGFSRTGGYYYFADRMCAALRASLEAALRRPVPVIPACTLPMDHLAARQQHLLTELGGIIERIGQVKRIHLVGHSAGGVDAQLLTCDRPLAADRWNPDDERLRDKVASVVGIAAPHHGTCLADAPIADLLSDPLRHAQLWPTLVRPLLHLSRLIATSEAAPVIGGYALQNLPDSAHFLWEIAVSRGLIYDLSPRAMRAVRSNNRSSRKVRLRSFVTATPDSASAEPFFRDLRTLTANTAHSPMEPLQQEAARVLQAAIDGAIQSGGVVIKFDEHMSDGVINSVRQLLNPDDPKELAGIVIGDHADVLGHYDRVDAFVGGRPLNQGLFHSGSRFGDNQFFELCRAIAGTVIESIRSTE